MSVCNVGYTCLHFISLLSISLWEFRLEENIFLSFEFYFSQPSLLTYSGEYTKTLWITLTGTMQSAEISSSTAHNEVRMSSSNTEALFTERNVPSDCFLNLTFWPFTGKSINAHILLLRLHLVFCTLWNKTNSGILNIIVSCSQKPSLYEHNVSESILLF